MMQVYLAIDLGAGSGRLVAGKYDGATLQLEEIHRFSNEGVEINGGYYWDTPRIFANVTEGIQKAIEKYGDRVVSVATDSWGCDFALLDCQGNVLGGHRQYRDPRIEGMQQAMNERIPLNEVFAHTGIQPAFYNSSLHLLAESIKGNPCFSIADRLLFTPDLLAFWLSGVRANERTITSTSQLYNPIARDWAWEVIDALGLPREMFGNIVSSGTVLGPLTDGMAEKTGATHGMKVVASAGHDTASAVAGLPMERGGLWLSSGTWSILGVESEQPVTTTEAFEAKLSNEGGVNKTTRLLHNVSGLWIIQECRREWAEQGEEMSYAELARLAEEAEPFTAFIDPNDPTFASPGDMPGKIRAFCKKTGQSVPESKGRILRIATDSLALKYRQVIEVLGKVTGRTFDALNAGGGGIQNELLMQATADAIGIPVIAGPTEATSCGNIITQMVATGELPDITAGRKLVAASMESKTFTPSASSVWQPHYEKFLTLIH
ncbi:MAG: rhamnulokinase [Akkermansiaceae bacterium]|nr:rhamnulokinase [Akkermansiaceae bacterium]